jgi:hypothetical protein
MIWTTAALAGAALAVWILIVRHALRERRRRRQSQQRSWGRRSVDQWERRNPQN